MNRAGFATHSAVLLATIFVDEHDLNARGISQRQRNAATSLRKNQRSHPLLHRRVVEKQAAWEAGCLHHVVLGCSEVGPATEVLKSVEEEVLWIHACWSPVSAVASR